MAEPPRSTPGQLRDLVLDALRQSNRPLAAAELIDAVRKHRPAFQSQVFRELLWLRRRGAIRKIHVAKAYVLDGNTRQLSLFCSHCGAIKGIAVDAAFDALAAAAAARSFRPESYAVETAGVCARCAR